MDNTIQNFQSFKGRTVDMEQPVSVYFNLHKKCYSIKQSGLVIGHCDGLRLRDATFKVNESGRQRVLREKQKNIHAFVTGYVRNVDQCGSFDSQQVTYNPYKYESFVSSTHLQPVTSALYVIIDRAGIRANLR